MTTRKKTFRNQRKNSNLSGKKLQQIRCQRNHRKVSAVARAHVGCVTSTQALSHKLHFIILSIPSGAIPPSSQCIHSFFDMLYTWLHNPCTALVDAKEVNWTPFPERSNGREENCFAGGGGGDDTDLPNPPLPLPVRRAGRGVWSGAALPAVPGGGGGSDANIHGSK